MTPTACLDPETLAAFAEGKLKRHEIPAVLAHLDRCPDCMRALETANDALAANPGSSAAGSGRFRVWSLAAAAAIVAVAVGLSIPGVRQWLRPASPMERLAELSPTSARTVEARLAGEF